jgi:lipopolysaccharide export LptBFGC system permease protein LptF
MAGVGWLTTSVESLHRGVWVAGLLGLARLPAFLVVMSPVVVALGAALAAGWMDANGERVALQSSGVSPARSGLVLVFLGAVVGTGQWAVADLGVHRAESAAMRLHGGGGSAWVWLDGVALRTSDGTEVQWRGGQIVEVRTGVHHPHAIVAAARQRQRPSTASGTVLATTSSVAARVEWHRRRARVLTCAALGLLAWLPVGWRPSHQVVMGLLIGGGAVVFEFLGPVVSAELGLPRVLGVWVVALVVWVAALVRATAR